MSSDPVKPDAKDPAPYSGSWVFSLSETEMAVLQAIRGMKYGSLEITVHDSRIVQIEKKEKMRFTGDPRNG